MKDRKTHDGSFRRVGIYKITSPSGKVYIGQAWHIPTRKRNYSSGKTIKQKKLHASIQKHGWYAHSFEVVHELPYDIDQVSLDQYEQIYMDAYRSCGIQLLNIREAGSRGRHKAESIKKISDSHKGKRIGRVPWNKGKTGVYSSETIAMIKSARAKQVIVRTDEVKETLRVAAIKRGISADNRKKMVDARMESYKSGNYQNSTAKLTPDQVKAIRQKYVPKKYTSTMLAKEYGICKTAVLAIVNNKTWTHIN